MASVVRRAKGRTGMHPSGVLSRPGGALSKAFAPTAEIGRFRLATTAMAVFSLESFARGLVVISPEAYERCWGFVDESPCLSWFVVTLVSGSVAMSLFVDYRAGSDERWPWAWQRRATRLLQVLGLAYLVGDAAVLRGPWLLGQAGRDDRITVWTARLSSAIAGVPLLAFALVLGFGATAWCVAAACDRSYRALSSQGDWRGTRRLSVIVWLLCILVFAAGFAAFAAFAAGGAV
jgi:hypothetical protein